MKTRLIVISIVSLLSATAFATTYVRVEPDGTKTYSDRPIPGGQPVELQSAQTYSSTPAPASASGLPAEQQLLKDMGEAFRYDSCSLRPAPDQAFVNPEQVSVGVTLKPSLRAGDVVDLRVDGNSAGQNSQSMTIKPVYRGSHTVTVSVKDRFGRQLCDSSTTFHVHQPSLNSPARQAPPPPPKPRPPPKPK